jgi:hypothetical protein
MAPKALQDLPAATGVEEIEPMTFGARPGASDVPYNASEIVALADSRFLLCDNNIGDALYELRLQPDGRMSCPLVRRPLVGVVPGMVDDLETLTMVEDGQRRFIFAMPSLCLKHRKKRHKKKSRRGKECLARGGLLRIGVGLDDRLEAEVLPTFRAWLIENAPELGPSPRYLPDDGGLNVEGLAWDADAHAILLGVRSPVFDGRPLILRVRVRDVGAPWTLSNLEMLPSVMLDVESSGGEQGVRGIEYDTLRRAMLVVIGHSTRESKAPFSLYSWDGGLRGTARRFPHVRFRPGMKVEGVVHGTVGGRGALVFVDDGGGYQVVWDDDPRLRQP